MVLSPGEGEEAPAPAPGHLQHDVGSGPEAVEAPLREAPVEVVAGETRLRAQVVAAGAAGAAGAALADWNYTFSPTPRSR